MADQNVPLSGEDGEQPTRCPVSREGSEICTATVHVHGCYADHGACDAPDQHDRCPTCGSRPDLDDTHRDGCPRLGTCGQYGPPWVPEGEWHPDLPMEDYEGDPPGAWQTAIHTHRRLLHPSLLVSGGYGELQS